MKGKLISSYLKQYKAILLLAFALLYCIVASSQDTSKALLDINNTKLIKKVNSFLDSNQKKINKIITDKSDAVKNKLNNVASKAVPTEIEKPLPYERLLNTKYTLARRAYQNTTAQFNYYFNADQELKEIITNVRNKFQEDYTTLLPFYDYDLSDIAKYSIDSIIYRCNANIVLHDLRNNWIDDAYLLMAKAYLYHKNFDTAASILQFINYSFDEKENGADIPIGSNVRNTNGKFSIATSENNRIWENENVRNESMLWQARNYFETGALNEGISLLQLLQADAFFPKRLYPFLHEQLAYGYYQMELYENAANNLIKALPNALDGNAKARWYFLIAQLFDKSEKKKEAYHWYEKASQVAINPILGVYAKINMIQYELSQGNTDWKLLASNLERLTKKDKYKPYNDIIYFEMAKIAIQNKAPLQASDWLIMSLKKPSNSFKQRQKAFELLGNINYQTENYAIAKMAYDSLAVVLKTNPQYENILLRKKWLSQVQLNHQIQLDQDSLANFYSLPSPQSTISFARWSKQKKETENTLRTLFIDQTIKKESIEEKNFTNNFNTNPGLGRNILSTSNNNLNNASSDFYFENPNTISMGKKSFVHKWGDRPNIDNWRRKASTNIAYGKINNNIQTANNLPTGNILKDSGNTSIHIDSNNAYKEIRTQQDLSTSLSIWNAAAIKTAQLFLLQLNDFEKALPIYQKIIQKNIDDATTERALLDLASQYTHLGKKQQADSIISIVTRSYPSGFYATKKNEAVKKLHNSNDIADTYKNAYFLAQIGDWEQLANLNNLLNPYFKNSKWNTPFQFLRVKMHAQLRQDSIAFILLDSIIVRNQNELIREKAKNIIKELKKRKETEAYLTNLKIVLPIRQPIAIEEVIVKENKATGTIQKTEVPIANKKEENIIAPKIIFTNDSLEDHYMAIVTNKVKEVFAKETKTAFNYLNTDEFKQLQLNTTHVQFDEDTYVVWIGPFDNKQACIQYIQKVKPRLKTELISFIPEKQYEIYIFGKSNILQISSKEDLKLYQEFMLKNIIK